MVTNQKEKTLLEEAAVSLLESDEYYQAHATNLISADQLKKRHLEEIRNMLKDKELANTLQRGLDIVHAEMGEVLKGDKLKEFQKDLAKINEKSLSKLPDALIEAFHEKRSFSIQEFLGLSDGTIRSIYAVGKGAADRGDFKNAADVFALATALNPFSPDLWNALGLCYQYLHQYQRAIDTFTMVSEMDPTKAGPRISLAECYLNLNQKPEAEKEIDIALKLIAKDPSLEKKWGTYLKSLTSK